MSNDRRELSSEEVALRVVLIAAGAVSIGSIAIATYCWGYVVLAIYGALVIAATAGVVWLLNKAYPDPERSARGRALRDQVDVAVGHDA